MSMWLVGSAGSLLTGLAWLTGVPDAVLAAVVVTLIGLLAVREQE